MKTRHRCHLGSSSVERACKRIRLKQTNHIPYGMPKDMAVADIKPGSYPNSINLGSRGVVPGQC